MSDDVIETTAVAVPDPPAEALALPAPANLRLVAFNPQQLQESQSRLIAWCEQKLATIAAEVAELEENLAIAKKAKWNTARPRAHVNRARKQLIYYEKILDALHAGYAIVPNFPCDLFAIRIHSDVGPSQGNKGTVGDYAQNFQTFGEVPDLLPAGEGRYVDPTPSATNFHRKVIIDGKEKVENRLIINGWEPEIDFPFVLAKPQVLDATRRAMALKVFDEMGVCPQTKKSDPLVLGIIKGPKIGYTQKRVTFLVAWFLDSEVL